MSDSELWEYPISANYVPNWGVREALREIIANALDTDENASVKWCDGYATVTDESIGISRQYWVLGEGVGGNFGTFREGLKMAMLVLARAKRDVVVSTVGYTLHPYLGYSERFQCNVLYCKVSANSRTEGTTVTVESLEEEYLSARDAFLQFASIPYLHDELGILDKPGALYVNGMHVQNITSVWGWNMTDRTLMNRDRSVIDTNKVKEIIGQKLSKLDNVTLMTELLNILQNTSFHNRIEAGIYFYPSAQAQSSWADAFTTVFGSKAMLPCDARIDLEAMNRGYMIGTVDHLPYSIRNALGYCGIPSSRTIMAEFNNQSPEPPDPPLTDDEIHIFSLAIDISGKWVPDSDPFGGFAVAQKLSWNDDVEALGCYRNDSGKIYILRSQLESLEMAVGTMIHERLHAIGHDDFTAEFETTLTDLIGKAVSTAYEMSL